MQDSIIKTNIVSFKKGETIFKEGDIGEEMYIIASGRVEVVKKVRDEELVLATLDANSFFGEMALFGDKHRSATVRAIEDTNMIPINNKILDIQLKKAPDWFGAIMRKLVLQLKDVNKRLKSRYYINLEYSLLKMFSWVINAHGKRDQGGIKAELGPVIHDVQMILGVSKDEVMDKLKDFSFIQMIKFSEATNEIFIPDEEKLKDFLLFIQGKNDKKTRLTSAFESLQKDTKKIQYFARIFQLLERKKGEKVDD